MNEPNYQAIEAILLCIITLVIITVAFVLIYYLMKEEQRKKEKESTSTTTTQSPQSTTIEEPTDMEEETSEENVEEVEQMEQTEEQSPTPPTPANEVKQEPHTTKEEQPSEPSSAPVISYYRQANKILEDEKETDRIIAKENRDLERASVPYYPSYEDDPSGVDLAKLDALRKDILRMTIELKQVKRTNNELKDMMGKLQKEHSDTLARLAYTDLWKAEKLKWSNDFEKAFRECETLRFNQPLASEREKEKPSK